MQKAIGGWVLCLAMMTAVPVAAKEIPRVAGEREGMSSERLARIAQMNERYTDSGKIAGTLTAVVRNGKIVHQSASGLKTVNGAPLASNGTNAVAAERLIESLIQTATHSESAA